jgi:hypothetical protein
VDYDDEIFGVVVGFLAFWPGLAGFGILKESVYETNVLALCSHSAGTGSPGLH